MIAQVFENIPMGNVPMNKVQEYIYYLYRYSYIIIRMCIWFIYIDICMYVYIWAEYGSGLGEPSGGQRAIDQVRSRPK